MFGLRGNSVRGLGYDQERRRTPRYLAKRRIVRDFWILTGIVMVCLPHPAAVCAFALLATFVSFMILDETE